MTVKFKIISLFPDLLSNYLNESFIAKAIGLNLLNVEIINLRNFSDNKYKSVDDTLYGGGEGMLIRPDILELALKSVLNSSLKQCVLYLSPQGVVINSEIVKQMSQSEFAKNKFEEIILISGRYAGVDQRFIDSYVHAELSIGDYVLSGGELPALVLIEAVTRFIPGVLGQLESAKNDSFENNLLEAPQYTKPAVWNGFEVPEVLLSGNHKKIADWKKAESVAVTLKKRPDLLNPQMLKGKNNET